MIAIRAAAPGQALAWARQEGWNPGLDDAERFAAADPGGFLLAELDGEPAGTVSLVTYDDRYAFLGLFIVRPDLRGRGIGGRLFAAALERAGGRVTGLDGVVEQQAYYARQGFEPRLRNVRWTGAGGGTAPPPEDVPTAALAAYDAAVFGAARPEFLARWTAHARVALRDGAVTGYGALRRCHDGVKVGPLLADDARTAAGLLTALRADAGEGTPVHLDAPDANAAATALLEEQGFAPGGFECARMERGGTGPTDWSRTYAITALELG